MDGTVAFPKQPPSSPVASHQPRVPQFSPTVTLTAWVSAGPPAKGSVPQHCLTADTCCKGSQAVCWSAWLTAGSAVPTTCPQDQEHKGSQNSVLVTAVYYKGQKGAAKEQVAGRGREGPPCRSRYGVGVHTLLAPECASAWKPSNPQLRVFHYIGVIDEVSGHW